MASERSSSPLSSAISMSDPSETLDQPMQAEYGQSIPPLGWTTGKHRERLSPSEKLKKASNYLRNELNLSPAEYIRLLFSQDDKGNRIRQKHFIEAAYTSPEILQYLQAHPAARVETLNALEWGVPELRKDIAMLAESELFGKYRVSDKDIASIENAALSATVADKAPHISQLLHAISGPSRSPGSPSRSSRITVHHPLNMIPHDESTNSSNLAVLDNIFRRQYRRDESSFVNRLSLVYGDQKTTQRIRTIKYRRERSMGPYDSLRWVLPIPALFHLKMNYLYMISRSHFGSGGSDQSTLYHAINFWQRKKISREASDFFALEELVVHSYQARICAIFRRLLDTLGLGNDADTIGDIIQSLDSTAVTKLLHEVRQFIVANRYTGDEELQNHIRFIELAEVYQLLKYAIKYGDIGLIRRAIDRCCIFFNGSGQHKYAFEMLYLQRLLSTSAATPTLQRAILSNSLVNFEGLSDSWFETDRMIEFHNGDMKTK
ncbi:MAG: hypothetical protein M1840_000723 [Geoglossum simile]|nr:MAG: hypothetical protein M1840_000723 [Geoglossum simile]